jgi:hypothetical protein
MRRILNPLPLPGLLLLLAACSTVAQPPATPRLRPGDAIGEMALRQGGADVVPIWAFCSPALPAPGVTRETCAVPPVPELSIGHGWWAKDEALRDKSWQAMRWELYLDDLPIDLEAFGTFDANLPQTGLPGYGADEEVITKLRSYAVVLENLTPGAHTLRSVLHLSQPVDDGFFGETVAGTYELLVSFEVEAAAAARSHSPSLREPRRAKSVPELIQDCDIYRCPQRRQGLCSLA